MVIVQRLLETSMENNIKRKCAYIGCGKELPYNRLKFCNKDCKGLFQMKRVDKGEAQMHKWYDRQYTLEVKKKKLLELQRQNYINEVLLEQLPSTPDLRVQLVDENGRLMLGKTDE